MQSFFQVTEHYHSATFALTPALSHKEMEKSGQKKASTRLAKIILEAM